MTYNSVFKAINALFAATAWTDHGYTTVPASYTGKISSTGNTVRVNIMQFDSSLLYNGDSVKGKIVCNIFVPVNLGMITATIISDHLDDLLKKKIISGNLQSTNSLTKNFGVDPMNTNLFRLDYEVNFNYNN